MRTRELQRFKKMLMVLREEIEGEIGRFESNMLHKNRKETTGEVSSFTTHPADMGAETAEYEKAYVLASTENEILSLIDDALARIDKGTYGLCVECGEKIPFERLRAIPYTPYCVDCKEKMENEEYVM
ncbi:TraR/DksA family transcriptional regulator [bacterium]|nr:MAG: TraR/DksA family transcriptional regulator [bacterium]